MKYKLKIGDLVSFGFGDLALDCYIGIIFAETEERITVYWVDRKFKGKKNYIFCYTKTLVSLKKLEIDAN